MMPSLSFLTFIGIALVVNAGDIRSGVCLPRLQTHPAEFKVCEKKICMMFIHEIPYTVLPEEFEKQDNQTVFKCKDAAAVFKGTRGIFFDIVKDMKQMDDVYCVYAGRNCRFNGMIDLAANPPGRKYRLGVGGLAFDLPHRRQMTLDPLATIIFGNFALFGKRKYEQGRAAGSVYIMLKPFRFTAWVYFAVCALFLFVLWLAVIYMSTGSLSLESLALVVVGNPRYAMEPAPEGATAHEKEEWRTLQETINLSNRFNMTAIRTAAKIFLAASIILWELTIVYYLFQQGSQPVAHLQRLSVDKLASYTLVKGGATETTFRREGKSITAIIEIRCQRSNANLFSFISTP